MRSNKAGIPGSNKEYIVSEDAKRYTLRDNSFTESKNGNFQYERNLSAVPSDKTAQKLKISINKEMSELKIKTLSPNGLKKVNLYQNDRFEDARKFAEYILENLVEEHVLEEV